MKFNAQILAVVAGFSVMSCQSVAQDPADLNDLEIAHVAYVADNIDIQYAHLALALSEHPAVRSFAEAMISDHNNVNAQALALLDKLNAQPQNNFLSESLQSSSREIVNELSQLRGAEFDLRYAENELAYHQAVNELVANAFIPNIENPEVKSLFEAGLKIFKAHEDLAANMVNQVKATR